MLQTVTGKFKMKINILILVEHVVIGKRICGKTLNDVYSEHIL